MAALEAEAEAIIEMVGRRAQQNHQLRELRATPAVQADTSETTASGEQRAATNGEAAPPEGSDQATPTESAAETPMDVDQPG